MKSLDTVTGGEGMAGEDGAATREVVSHCGAIRPLTWHVIETEHRQETLARDSIQAVGFAAFLPQVAVMLGRARVVRPLFPRYLFALFSPGDDWGGLRRARGVVDVLRGVGTAAPAIVATSHVEAIMAHCSARQVVEEDPRPHLIAAGVAVTIRDGLWSGHSGVCLWSSHERVRLMMDVLGVALNLPRRAVVEAEGEG